MPRTYDFAVVGAGVFGAWTAHCLRRAGATVALLDAYGPANSRASSGGETRIIRMGYGPDELYTQWAARSLPMWRDFFDRVRHSTSLFQRTGVLWLGNESDQFLQQMLEAVRRAGAECEQLSATEIQKGYPQLSFPDVTWGVLEPNSGILKARQAVLAVVEDAVQNGVNYLNAAVLPPQGSGKLTQVKTSAGSSVSAGTFVFACGAWLPKVFPDLLAGRIHPTRQEVFFFGVPAGNEEYRVPRMPAWLHHSHPDRVYSIPDIDNRGFKVALDRHGPDIDPDRAMRVVSQESIDQVRAYLKQHVPGLANAPVLETRVCQYENTSNGDFLIDRHPELENVWIVGGGSGHGFKHGPAVGEYVSTCILKNAPAEPRFSLASKQTARMRTVY